MFLIDIFSGSMLSNVLEFRDDAGNEIAYCQHRPCNDAGNAAGNDAGNDAGDGHLNIKIKIDIFSGSMLSNVLEFRDDAGNEIAYCQHRPCNDAGNEHLNIKIEIEIDIFSGSMLSNVLEFRDDAGNEIAFFEKKKKTKCGQSVAMVSIWVFEYFSILVF